MQAFDRYSAFTDVAALKAASGKPLRKSMRVNLLKSTPDVFRTWAQQKGWKIGPVPWCPEGFFVDRVDREEALGKDLLHLLGHTYMQEAASMLPVVLLDPKPGQSVLDMSAAPGSKTTQIASAMGESGVIVANDVQEKRLWSLASNLQRCGVLNVVVTRKVGQWFSKQMTERFDRVLCDAPCTAQGTVRKDSDALTYASTDNIGKMASLQRELLEAAVHAAKVGGRIVYSTCTLTPEENEDVVGSILNKFSDQLEVIDPSAELGIDLAQATTDSRKVQESLGRPMHPMFRLWPQTYDTEGFFCAVIEKRAPTRARVHIDEPSLHPVEVLPGARQKEQRNRLMDWYGTSFVRENEQLMLSKENIWITTDAVLGFRLPVRSYLLGLPFGKMTDHGLARLSHEMTTLRGAEAVKQVVTLDGEILKQFLRGANIPWQGSGNDDGDVLIHMPKSDDIPPIPIGRGLLKNGTILSRLTREIVRMFA